MSTANSILGLSTLGIATATAANAWKGPKKNEKKPLKNIISGGVGSIVGASMTGSVANAVKLVP